MRPLKLDLFVSNLLLFPLYFGSHLFPRLRRVCFGSGQQAFNGNAKYLMMHIARTHPDLDIAWIATSRSVRDEVRRRGYKSFHKFEPKGLWYSLTARLYVFNNRLTDINYWTSGRAITMNLWHGIGLKALGFASRTPANRRDFNPKSLYRRFIRPHYYARPTWFGSTSPLMSSNFAKAFRIPESSCLNVGYPRSDHFFVSPAEREALLERTETPETLAFVRSLAGFDKVVLYMPTYRDSHSDFIAAAGIDYERLNAVMQKQNGLFIFKLHPWTKLKMPEDGRYTNLRFAPAEGDPYPYMPLTHVLVTDYSSVYYDYLLLRRPVILFAFDRAHYESKERDLTLDFDTYTPGVRAATFDELLALLEADLPGETPEQAEVRRLFWGDYSGQAANALTAEILEILDGPAPASKQDRKSE